ncbi:MAG: 50S ribosomal protein L33 [Clostridia bacterium]|nr:50S ribosomal protein L33 [Clostridia bacterium]
MAANGKRVKITLSCTECKQRNYNTMKNKQNSPDRLEMNKYCRFCRKHTLHKETKSHRRRTDGKKGSIRSC